MPIQSLSDAFQESQDRLLNLAKRNMSAELLRLFSVEDVIQESLMAASEKEDFMENNPEIPAYFKLRLLVFQTIAALERKYLQAHKRSILHEIQVVGNDDDTSSQAQLRWNDFADTITSPLSRIARNERCQLLWEALDSLPEPDREILIMRHFDGLPIKTCADMLHISAKAASMRHVRAIERLRERLEQNAEFKS